MADRQGLLYAGTNLTLTCTVTFEERVDIPVTESITWIKNGEEHSIFGNSRTIEMTTSSDTTNITSLQFHPLKDGKDDGVYSCSVVMDPFNKPFVRQLNISKTVNLTVLGQSLFMLSQEVNSFQCILQGCIAQFK